MVLKPFSEASFPTRGRAVSVTGFSGVREPYARRDSEAGMVTTELALGMIPLAVIVVLVMAMVAVAAVYMDVHLTGVMLARAASIGADSAELQRLADAALPGCHIALTHRDGLVEVAVGHKPSGVLSVWGEVDATATAMMEPGVSP